MLVEVSVLDKTFEHLNLSLQDITAIPKVFSRNICHTKLRFTQTASCSTTANVHET